MNIIIEIFQGLGGIVIGVINLYIWVIIISALLSFVNPDPFNPVVQILRKLTNPAYMLVKRFVKTNFSGLDLAPLIIIIALQVLIVVLKALTY
ncbi:MAG: YggT family protein [Sulfurimonadaceae bacterium]|jgi:YggT family protein|nr:YggT family protein [Sulfurimonadaceae bacterium]